MSSVFAVPKFFEDDIQQIIANMNATYESLSNKPLQPAQTEAIMIKLFAHYAQQSANKYNDGSANQLISFSQGVMLDLLVEVFNVKRLVPQSATCTLEFTIVQGHAGVTIPQGTRVQSPDGKAVFETKIAVSVPVGTYIADALAVCQTAGVVGNGYIIGSVSTILDPQPYILSAINLEVTAGGAEKETDEQLQARTKLSPNGLSTSTKKGYQFLALSAHPDVIDVRVLGPEDHDIPGLVRVYPLVKGGITTPIQIINSVTAILTDDKNKGVCDTIEVISPTAKDYAITIGLVLFNDAVDQDVLDSCNQVVNDFKEDATAKLGIDIVRTSLSTICKNVSSTVYDAVVTLPAANVSVAPTEFANCTAVSVTITGHTNG